MNKSKLKLKENMAARNNLDVLITPQEDSCTESLVS